MQNAPPRPSDARYACRTENRPRSATDASSVPPARGIGTLSVGEAKRHHRTALQQLDTLSTCKMRRHDHPTPVTLVVPKTDRGARQTRLASLRRAGSVHSRLERPKDTTGLLSSSWIPSLRAKCAATTIRRPLVSTESLAVTTLLTKRHANIGCERYPRSEHSLIGTRSGVGGNKQQNRARARYTSRRTTCTASFRTN